MTQQYILLVDDEFKAQMGRLYAAHQQDANSPAGREYTAAMTALTALRNGRESDYEGKQLGYGPSSHDLRDCAELKVPVFRRRDRDGNDRSPSHRMTYREFDAMPRMSRGADGELTRGPDALPFRHVVAFERRDAHPDPASVTGQRLGRQRGIPVRDLAGLGGGRPDVGPQRPGAQTTPNRITVPADMMTAARFAQDRAIAPAQGAVQAPNASGDQPGRRTSGVADDRSRDR